MSKKQRKLFDDWRLAGYPVEANVTTDGVMITATPASQGGATAYADGDAIGTVMTFTNAARANGGSGRVESITVCSNATRPEVNMELVLFNESPAGATITDNAALILTNADLLKVMGAVVIDTWQTFHYGSVGTPTPTDPINLPFKSASTNRNIYGAMIASASCVYAIGDLDVRLGVVQF